MKVCLYCKIKKPHSDYAYNKNREDGYSAICKDCKREYDKEYRAKNKDKIKEKKAAYVTANRDKVNEYKRTSGVWQRYSKKASKDPGFKIKIALRARMHNAIKKGREDHSIAYLGCSIEVFKKYIAQQFKQGMGWDNYGHSTWHLDHIKPCAAFDLSKEDQIKKCFHYTNYQPLWAKDNLIKQAKYKGVDYTKR